MMSLSWAQLGVFAAGALLMGFSKTSFGGVGAIAVALYALGMPAKESTATVLLLAIIGDVVAVSLMGRHVRWRLLWHLVPTVIPGLLLGALFIRLVDDVTMRRTIGAVLLVSLGIQLWERRRGNEKTATRPRWLVAGATGIAAGFTTMTANAAGPVMALYLLAARVDKARFIGTNAWFFAIINLSKTPLTGALGLFTPQVLGTAVAMVPVVLIGTVLGRLIVHRVTQQQFEIATLAASALASLSLLLR